MGKKIHLLLIAVTFLLVRNGMVFCSSNEDDTTENVRIVHFPEDRSVGKIIHEIDEASGLRLRKSYDAQGDVRLPANTKLKFNAITGTPLPKSVLRESLVGLDLVELKLFEADITNQDLAYVAELTSVERLHLADNPITDKGLEHLSSMPNLWSLRICDAEITDEGVKHLKRFPALKNLELTITQITDRSAEMLAGLEQLTQPSSGTNQGGCKNETQNKDLAHCHA